LLFSQTSSSADVQCRPLCQLEFSSSIEDHDYIDKDVVPQLQEIRQPNNHLIISSEDDDTYFIELSYGLRFGDADSEIKLERGQTEIESYGEV